MFAEKLCSLASCPLTWRVLSALAHGTIVGPPGNTGPKGDRGYLGPKGDRGTVVILQGHTVELHFQQGLTLGHNRSMVFLSAGEVGRPGPPGLQGLHGQDGYRGEKGEKGKHLTLFAPFGIFCETKSHAAQQLFFIPLFSFQVQVKLGLVVGVGASVFKVF